MPGKASFSAPISQWLSLSGQEAVSLYDTCDLELVIGLSMNPESGPPEPYLRLDSQ